MTPHFLIWSLGPKIGSVGRICHQTDSMNRFYLDVTTGPKVVCVLIVFAVSRGGITVGSVLSPPPLLAFVFPCTSRFNFPLFSCVRRTSLLRYNIVSMFQFIFLLYFSFGWSSKPTGDSGEGPAIIYDYFLESVYTGVSSRRCFLSR